MKKKIFIILLGFLIFNIGFSQNSKKYLELIKEAKKLYKSKEYQKSGQKFSEAFLVFGNRSNAYDRYYTTYSWFFANEIDSAFAQLFEIAKSENLNIYNKILADSNLIPLHSDKRWNEVTEIINTKKEKLEAKQNKELIAILDTIYQDDQKYRKQKRELGKKYGWDSEEMKAHRKKISEKDSINLLKVKKILDEYGWLGSDIIGRQGNLTMFLVIQHSDLENQLKYLPMIREATKKGDINMANFVLLEDRIALRQGKKQIYGSQFGRDEETGEYYIRPLIDPKNVDKRRAKAGLGTLQEYISCQGLTWDADEYEKKLSEIEAKEK